MIICGFPGIGKTTTANLFPDLVIDAESSEYAKDDSFSQKYVDHLLDLDKHYKYVFASCHQEVREELQHRDIPYLVIIPDSSLKNDYLIRYLKRGNDINFITKLDKNWEYWIYTIEKEEAPVIYIKHSYTPLKDYLDLPRPANVWEEF